MNRYRLVKAGIDVNEGISRFSGKKEIYEKCLYDFPADTHYAQMLKAIEEKDVKAAFSAGHALKGIAGNLSMKNLYEAIVPLVEIFRADSFDGADELIGTVKESYDKIIEVLTAE